MRSALREEFDHALSVHADRVAVREVGGGELSFADLDRWATAVSRQLQERGVGAGDVVALYMHNRAEFLVTDVAVARVGAVKLPINYMLPPENVAYILDSSGAKVVVSDAILVARTADAAQACRTAPDILQVAENDAVNAAAAPLASLPIEGVDPLTYGANPVSADDVAALYYTGGTTGRPKGVRHTQRSTVALHYAQMLEAEIHEDDVLLLMTPMAHAAGLFAQSALIRGATIVVNDGFDAELAIRLMVEENVTWTFLVPTMIYRILDLLEGLPERPDSLRTVVYGAAPITHSRLKQALETFGPVFVQLYGQTESPNWGTRLSKSDHDLSRPDLLTSCGRASIMADVMVVDDDGNPVAVDEAGEICLRTPYLLLDYLDAPEATAEKFLGSWIRTGDVGTLDEKGYLRLLDRKSDMVITGGMNVYCKEVEDVLAAHPDVSAVAVIGVPHEDWGESVHAVVIPHSRDLDSTELLTWAKQRLARYAAPKSVELVDSLPETPFGKVDKKALRAPYWGDRNRGIA